jgi:hypothetical protein
MAAAPRSRPFGLSDALLLVAATALGLALTRSLSGFLAIDRSESINYRSNGRTPIAHRTTLSRAYGEIRPPTSQVAHVRFWFERAAFWPCPCLLAWTSVVLARGVLPPRRPRFKSQALPALARSHQPPVPRRPGGNIRRGQALNPYQTRGSKSRDLTSAASFLPAASRRFRQYLRRRYSYKLPLMGRA